MFNLVLLSQGGHISFFKNDDTEKKLKHWLQIRWLKEMLSKRFRNHRVFLFPLLVKINLRACLQSAETFIQRHDSKVELQGHHPVHQLHLHLLKAAHDLLLVTGKSHAEPSQIPARRKHTLDVGMDSVGSTPQYFTLAKRQTFYRN